MKPTDILRHEHDVIMLVLDAADAIVLSEGIDVADVRSITDFVKNFADGCHHAKEEKELFVRLGKHGFSSEQGPVAVMLHEHEQGRAYIRNIIGALPLAEKGDRNAIGVVKENLAGYVRLLRGHINKENNILFPMSDSVLTPVDQRELETQFERIEREEMGVGTHDRYHELAHTLQKKYRLVGV